MTQICPSFSEREIFQSIPVGSSEVKEISTWTCFGGFDVCEQMRAIEIIEITDPVDKTDAPAFILIELRPERCPVKKPRL